MKQARNKRNKRNKSGQGLSNSDEFCPEVVLSPEGVVEGPEGVVEGPEGVVEGPDEGVVEGFPLNASFLRANAHRLRVRVCE